MVWSRTWVDLLNQLTRGWSAHKCNTRLELQSWHWFVCFLHQQRTPFAVVLLIIIIIIRTEGEKGVPDQSVPGIRNVQTPRVSTWTIMASSSGLKRRKGCQTRLFRVSEMGTTPPPSGYQPGQSWHRRQDWRGEGVPDQSVPGIIKWAPNSLRLSTWTILIIKTHQISVFDIYIYNRPKWPSTHQCTIHWMHVITQLWMNETSTELIFGFHFRNQFCKKKKKKGLKSIGR
jgi:hypothetical protein